MKLGLRFAGIGMIAVGAVLAVMFFFSGPQAPVGEFTKKMYIKEKVISGAYKTYAIKDVPVPMWLAKTVFHNGTDQRISNLRVRYRVTEYSDWCAWRSHIAVDPDQTVVDLYYPILNSNCAKLTSRAPAELQMEVEYTDPMGQKHQTAENKQLTMLDRHEFIFSDLTAEERTASFQDVVTYSHLLAAWVSRSDDVVARLASMANKKAGGVGASSNDENCVKVMNALYETMRAIHISYQHPPALIDKNLSYDIKLVQSLQYPRDTIQKRSGTCIDLAILYAAMLNSVNIEPFLVVIDGHCFPMARMPSGRLLPVEATGVGDGYDKGMNFEQAVKSAMETWQKVNQSGRLVPVDVRQCWMAGVANPELESLPADILDRWGITALMETPQGKGAQQPAQVAVAQPNQNVEQPTQPPMPTSPSLSVEGVWTFTVQGAAGPVNGRMEISRKGNQLRLVGGSSYQMAGPDGRNHQFHEKDECVGAMSGQTFQARCDSVTTTMDGQRIPPQGLPLYLNLYVDASGRAMQGQVSNSMGASTAISMRKN
ncbi:MAG: transglutaminase-like domain-containing protein [Syntrophobacter sp.]